VALDPKSPAVYAARGDVFLKTGRFEKAVADYTKVLTLDPKAARAYANRAAAYARLGRTDRARADLAKAKKLDATFAKLEKVEPAFLKAPWSPVGESGLETTLTLPLPSSPPNP
jgi:tetratricopeptide (TPR) repeat protein